MCDDGGELGTGVTPGGFRGAGAADAGECERDACGAAAGVAFRGVFEQRAGTAARTGAGGVGDAGVAGKEVVLEEGTVGVGCLLMGCHDGDDVNTTQCTVTTQYIITKQTIHCNILA